MFAYSLAPIDFWTGWLTEEQYLLQLAEEAIRSENYTATLEQIAARYQRQKARAFALAKEIGWEGDIRQGCGPFIAGLPADEPGADSQIMIAWKQHNNGETFVVSPQPLPALGRGTPERWQQPKV